MKNITNIKNYKEEKEFKIAIPNKVLLGFEYESLKEEEMQQSKIIHLYYSLILLTPMGINSIPYITLSALCKLSKIKATSSTLKSMKNRLKFLQKENLIIVKEELDTINKNDLFEIKIIINKEIMDNNFTFLSTNEVETFLSLECNEGILFLYYKRHWNKKIGYAFPSMETMSEELGLSKNTICKANKNLIKLGILKKDNPNFYSRDVYTGQIKNSNNRYSLNLNNCFKETNDKNRKNDKENNIEHKNILNENQLNEIPF